MPLSSLPGGSYDDRDCVHAAPDTEHTHSRFFRKTDAPDLAPHYTLRTPSRDQTYIPFASLYKRRRRPSTAPSPSTHPFPKMPKKRPSLQLIFVPSKFLSSSQPQSPTTAPTQRDPAWPDPPLSSRTRAFSEVPRPRPRPAHARQPSSSSLASSYADLVHHGEVDLPFPAPQPGSSPPSGDLLPDDPFANLSPGASVLAFPSPLPSPALPVPAPPPPPTPTPKSPLSPSRPALRPSASTSTLPVPAKVRPAHTRPAFASRPSLPSLRVLARAGVVVKKKARKGTPGAHLPAEPWNDTDSRRSSTSSEDSRLSVSSAPNSRAPSPTPSPTSSGSDTTVHGESLLGAPLLNVRPVSTFELDFDEALAGPSSAPSEDTQEGVNAESEEFTLAFLEPEAWDHPDEGYSGFTTPALTLDYGSSCAVSPDAGQVEFPPIEWRDDEEGLLGDGLAYLRPEEALPAGGSADLQDPSAADTDIPSSSTCETSNESNPAPGCTHALASQYDIGASSARAAHTSSVLNIPPLAPSTLTEALPALRYAVERSRSRSPTTLLWAPRARDGPAEDGTEDSIGPGGPHAHAFGGGAIIASSEGEVRGIEPAARAEEGVADPTVDGAAPSHLRPYHQEAAEPLPAAFASGDQDQSYCYASTGSSSHSHSHSSSSSSTCASSSSSAVTSPCSPSKPLPPLPPSIPFPTADDEEMPKVYGAHDADLATEFSETGRTEFFDAASEVGSDAGSTSTIRGGYVKVEEEEAVSHLGLRAGPPGGWPGERASTYGFVYAKERERTGSAATVTGVQGGRQRVGSAATVSAPRGRRESSSPAAHAPAIAKRESVSIAQVASRIRRESASVPTPASVPGSSRQSTASGAPSRLQRESITPSVSSQVASPRQSTLNSTSPRIRKDSVASIANKPLPANPRPVNEPRLSRASMSTPVPPERASYASTSTVGPEKERGSYVPVSVREGVNARPAHRDTFGVTSPPTSSPRDRTVSVTKSPLATRERKESVSTSTSVPFPATSTTSAPITISTETKTGSDSSSNPSSPSTTRSAHSSSSPPPPIPPRSGRRPSYDYGRRAAGGAAVIDHKIVVGESSSSASPTNSSGSGSTPATTPEREKDMPALVVAPVAAPFSTTPAAYTSSTKGRSSLESAKPGRGHARSMSRGRAKYYGEVSQDPLASPPGSPRPPTPPTNGAVRAFVVNPNDADTGRVSYNSFKTNGTGAGGAVGKKNGSAFTGLWQYDIELVDGEERHGEGRAGGKPSGGGYTGLWSYGGSASGKGAANGRSNGTGGGAGGRDDDDDERRGDRRGRPSAGPSSFSDSDESDSSLTDSDDVGDENKTEIMPTDDDVPLARSIPTALKAQKSIRQQVRDERKRKKRNLHTLAVSHGLREESSFEGPPRSPVGVNQRQAFPAGMNEMEARGREAARPLRNNSIRPQAVDPYAFPPISPQSATAPAPGSRPRTKTLPGGTANPISVDELTQKLMNVKASGVPPSTISRPPSRDGEGGSSGFFGKKLSRPGSRDGEGTSGGNFLARMRSSRKPQDVTAAAAPLPPNAPQSLGRSGTTRGVVSSRRPSVDREREQYISKASSEERGRTYSAGYKSGTSIERARSVSRPRAVPPSELPPPPPVPPVLRDKVQVVQQRVFVGDLQRFHTVEIGPSTTADDVLKMVAGQGGLDDIVGSGGWMLWEVAQDFGMERPIRGFEILTDVFTSWNKDKMVNMLMIKRTLLEPILRRSALPSSSPLCRGYVEYEVKRGKWNKRWLELREHSLYLAKRDNGKDETFLCSLSNFDAYHVTRLHKAPKPYTFAVKSTDNLSFFENTADYVHVFSCPEREGQMWMEKILLARSYMLIQERTVLMAKTGGLNGSGGAKGLVRAPTRKQPPRVNQTLVQPPTTTVFEPGSLLAKR